MAEYASLSHFKSIATFEFYTSPGDFNHILSRWMLAHGIYPECFWQACQTLEKYMKAGIVLNGGDIRKLGHDLSKLYERHTEIFQDLAVDSFRTPVKVREIWRDEPVDSFVSRLSRIGHPTSRYGMMSWWRQADDLFKIDQLAFRFRRVAIELEWKVGLEIPGQRPDYWQSNLTCRDLLRMHENLTINKPPSLPESRIDLLGNTIRDVYASWNLALPGEEIPEKIPSEVIADLHARNSHMFFFFERLRKPTISKIELDGLNWVIESFPGLGKQTLESLESLIAKHQ